MSRASFVPVFDPDGAPLSVLVDFDGTISLEDIGDVLLTRLVEDQEAVRRKDQAYVDGRIGSRELHLWDLDALPRDPERLQREIDTIGIDETFAELVAVTQRVGGSVEIVSDGLGFHVEPMLARLGLERLPIATNATVPGAGGDGVSFPYGHPACHVCGTCKRERIRAHQAADRAVVFVGDGPSDRYAAHHADVIFAKASLAAWCEVESVPYEPWERLADVAEWLEAALFDRRLPATSSAFEEWATRSRPEAATFICGPEVWGEHRSTAPPAPVRAHRRP